MRKWSAIFCLLLIFSFVAVLFWYNEWRYSLPTPVPVRYQPVSRNMKIDLPFQLKLLKSENVFLHFFNPDCPCSRFNIQNLKFLVEEYGEKINFAIVVITKVKNYTEEKIQEKYHLTVPVLFDSNLDIACRVYSTPQAVLLNSNRILYYRGNYKSPYCTDKKTSYAQIAIESLLAGYRLPAFNLYALKA